MVQLPGATLPNAVPFSATTGKRLVADLGVGKHAITGKRPGDRDPSYRAWHKQATMFVLWMGSTSNLGCFARGVSSVNHGLGLDNDVDPPAQAEGRQLTAACMTILSVM